MEIPICANPHARRVARALPPLAVLAAAVFFSIACAAQSRPPQPRIVLTVIDENGVAISGAQVTILEPNVPLLHLWTDFAGHCAFTLPSNAQPYEVTVQKPGFYQSSQNAVSPALAALHLVIAHEQIVKEQISVSASPPGIDVQQVSNAKMMNTPEIVNIPYPTSRDIRLLLPYNPGVIEGTNQQVHVAGSETWQTLDMLDGFDIRSPYSGSLGIRVSSDAVRSIDVESTRYPVQYGRASGGVIALYTGMGDNKFRFNATNFVPSFHQVNGLRFDKFVPRFTFSGPLLRNRAWFYDGLELEYDNVYIAELPKNDNTNHLIRGSNLFKLQSNLSSSSILTAGLLVNSYHSPHEGLSSLTPQVSTTKRDIVAWFPYLREQFTFHNGTLLDAGVADIRFRDGHEPHGNTAYAITPELSQGSYFENLTGRSQRSEAKAALYLPAIHWRGEHNVQAGIAINHTGYHEDVARIPVSYVREDGTLLRRSTFSPVSPFALRNFAAGAYVQDRWNFTKGLLLEPGLRFDWDQIISRPLFSPRLAAAYSPPGYDGSTKFSAGIGLYYDQTEFEYLERAHSGARSDTYYACDGKTPTGPSQQTIFTYGKYLLHSPRALNWSVAAEQKIPGSIYAGAEFLQKRTSNLFTYVNQSGPAALSGTYFLTNSRLDSYKSIEIDARRLFANGYTLFGAYTHSYARTNAALDYMPTPSPLGPQQSGPLPWNVPNRILSWGWLPFDLPWFKKSWDVVYTYEWHDGEPITSVDAAQQVAGAVGSHRFPNFINFSPGLEWRFHFRGQYWGLRGVMENALDNSNPAIVDNVVDSPQYLHFSEFEGRALTARIRLIGARK
ncbi:MAG TPA: carboxypeptidase regulatory-like domain-containing protein [Bryobacteraceae bacterium]|nr:carboxypeptidase regulatory-like domain-containing protein [Bryobacteraceae bacterium]